MSSSLTPDAPSHGAAQGSKKVPLLAGPPKPPKIPRTFRFNLELGESNDQTYPEFSWTELVRGATAKRVAAKAKTGTTVLNPYASDDDDDLKAMAARFEQKYNKPAAKGKRRAEDYIDRGAGYDESDSFIDNTDVYDEIVPADLQTVHGGFYINSGSLEFKEVEMSEDEDESLNRVKKDKPVRKNSVSLCPNAQQQSGAVPKETNSEPVASSSKPDQKPKRRISPVPMKKVDTKEMQSQNTNNGSHANTPTGISTATKSQGISSSTVNKSISNDAKSKSGVPSDLTQQNSKPVLKPVPTLAAVKKPSAMVIASSSSSSSSSSSDGSSSSSDSDSSSSEEDDEDEEEEDSESKKIDEKDKDKLKPALVEDRLPKLKPKIHVQDNKMPKLSPQIQTQSQNPNPSPSPSPIPNPPKRLKTKNVPPNPNLPKNKPSATVSVTYTSKLNTSVNKVKELQLQSSSNSRAGSPNASGLGVNSGPLPRTQSPSGLNLSLGMSVTPTSATATTIIKIPTPKSTPTPTSSPVGITYTSTASTSQHKQSMPLNLLKPKPKPRTSKILNPTPATITAQDIFNTLTSFNNMSAASIMSQGSANNNLGNNKPTPKQRVKLATSAVANQHSGSVRKSQHLSSNPQQPKSLKLKAKHALSPMLASNSATNSASAAAAMLALTNSAASQIATLATLSSFRQPPPLTSAAVEITKLRPAHLSSNSSASTSPNPFKSLSHLGTGITVTEVNDKIRAITSSPVSSATASAATYSSNTNSHHAHSSSSPGVSTLSNNNSASMSVNRIPQSITITPTPLLNLSTSGSDRDRSSNTNASISNFSSSSRVSSSSLTSHQKPSKHITPYDVNALLGKMESSPPNSNSSTGANAMKASIEKIMFGNGLNPRDLQKK